MNDTKHKKNRTWSDEEKSSHKEDYGCEIIIENGTLAECNTRNAPTDALIVHYIHNDRDCYDLTRGSRTKLFDMYYDKFTSVKRIEYGQGMIKPSLWGYSGEAAPKKKKRK